MTKRELVDKHIETLKKLDWPALVNWGKAYGCDSRAGFGAFKKALAANGIDANATRDAYRQKTYGDALAGADDHILTLTTDAAINKFGGGKFAIVAEDGSLVWWGAFFDSDFDFDGDQASAEKAAVNKAVYLAKLAARGAGLKAITLRVKTDAEWLTWANGAADLDHNAEPKKLCCH